jgi:hypothetical protein
MEPNCDPLETLGWFMTLAGLVAIGGSAFLLDRGKKVLAIAGFQLDRSGQTIEFMSARITELEAALKETGATVPPPRNYPLDAF